MCWIERGVEILPLASKFSVMAAQSLEIDSMRQGMIGAVKALRCSGKKLSVEMGRFLESQSEEAGQNDDPEEDEAAISDEVLFFSENLLFLI